MPWKDMSSEAFREKKKKEKTDLQLQDSHWLHFQRKVRDLNT